MAGRKQPQLVFDELAELRTRLTALEAREPGIRPECHVYHSIAQNIPTGPWAALAFDSERVDTDDMHDVAVNNSRIVIPVAGRYEVDGGINFAANNIGHRGIAVRLNGVTFLRVATQPTVAGSDDLALAFAYRFAASDYIELMVAQTSGGGLNVTSTGNFSPEFAAVLVTY